MYVNCLFCSPHAGLQRLREQNTGQILWDWLHKTEGDRRQQTQGRHTGGGRQNRAVQARVSVDLRVGNPRQTPVGGDLHQRQHTQCEWTDRKLCAWFNLPHEITAPPHLPPYAVEEEKGDVHPSSAALVRQSEHRKSSLIVSNMTSCQSDWPSLIINVIITTVKRIQM